MQVQGGFPTLIEDRRGSAGQLPGFDAGVDPDTRENSRAVEILSPSSSLKPRSPRFLLSSCFRAKKVASSLVELHEDMAVACGYGEGSLRLETRRLKGIHDGKREKKRSCVKLLALRHGG
ncbi:hypothetical protein E2542_SST09559 [Spatholobus suberectus]|nr:hypothetical protein E2542_SST09559 [Spatholobus suberectus]